MRYIFRVLMLPFLFAAAYGVEQAPSKAEFHGETAQNFIAALINGSDTLQDYVFSSKNPKISFTITNLDISETDRLDAYVPADGLYALPSASADGDIMPENSHEHFMDPMYLYQAVSALKLEPDYNMGRNHFLLKQVSCQIDHASSDINTRFSCYYIPQD